MPPQKRARGKVSGILKARQSTSRTRHNLLARIPEQQKGNAPKEAGRGAERLATPIPQRIHHCSFLVPSIQQGWEVELAEGQPTLVEGSVEGKRIVWSFEAETRRSKQVGTRWARTSDSCARESIARGEICGQCGAEAGAAMLANAARDAAEVETLRVEAEAGVCGPAVGGDRSQWGSAPFGAAGVENPLTRSIPARAREVALAPRMCRYRAHCLRLDVGTHIFIIGGHVAVWRRGFRAMCLQPGAGAVRLGDSSDVDGSEGNVEPDPVRYRCWKIGRAHV